MDWFRRPADVVKWILLCVWVSLMATTVAGSTICKPACTKEALSENMVYNPVENILIPSSGNCNFHGFPYGDSLACMRGAWVILLGGSVTCVNFYRTAGLFYSGGKDTSYWSRKNITREFRKNVDLVFPSEGPKVKEYSVPADHVKGRMTPEITANSAVKFLHDANTANVRSLPEGVSATFRITFLNDQYFFIVTKLAEQLKRLRGGLASKGITRVYMIVGPTGKWYEMCEPQQVKRFPRWACLATFLQKKSPDQLMKIYESTISKAIDALAQAKRANSLTSAIVLSYKSQYSRAVQASLDKSLRKYGNTSFLPVHQRHYYWNWFSTPLTASLTTPDYREEFQGHPTGRSSHWYWMLALTSFCPNSAQSGPDKATNASFCPSRPVFSAKCYEDYMYTVNPASLLRSKGTPSIGNPPLPTWQQGIEIKGCSVSSASYAPLLAVKLDGWSAALDDSSIGESAGEVQDTTTFMGKHYRRALLAVSVIVVLFWFFRGWSGHNRSEVRVGAAQDSLRIDSIVFSRYISSVHVVAGHMQQKGFTLLPLPKHVISWGFTWVPFFFMLSGFVLTYVKIIKLPSINSNSERPHLKIERPIEFVRKRAMNTYPLYLAGLIGSALFSWVTATQTVKVDASMVLQEVLLIQAWFPSTIESTLQAHCWFISCELLYWFLFPSIVQGLYKLSRFSLTVVVLVCSVILPWTATVIIPWALGEPSNWYSSHVPSHTSTWRDFIVVVMKFHPLCYLHLFILGCACAFVFRIYKQDANSEDTRDDVDGRVKAILQHYSPNESAVTSRVRGWLGLSFVYIVENGATLGYISLASIFYFSFLKPYGAKLSLRLGLLAPFHALILLGLASGKDRLSRLFSHWLLQTIGNWSYAQFIFQFLVYHFFSHILNGGGCSGVVVAAEFMFFLTAIAACGYNMFQLPLREEWGFRRFLLAAFPVCVAWGLIACGAFKVPSFRQNLTRRTAVPYVKYELGCFDSRLNLTLPESGRGFLINPTIVKVPGTSNTFLIAVRSHLLEVAKSSHRSDDGKVSNIVRSIYHSSLTLGYLEISEAGQLFVQKGALTSFLPTPPSQSPRTSTWLPCLSPPVYLPANRTYVQVETTGPQDPRFFKWDGKLWISFFSMRPADHPGKMCLENAENKTAMGTIYIAPIAVTNTQKSIPTGAMSIELPLDPERWARPHNTVEKNFLVFQSGTGLFYIYRIFPHVVYLFAQAGKVLDLPQRIVGDSRLLSDLLLRQNVFDDGLVAHGGATPIALSHSMHKFGSTAGTKLYLASFHTTNPMDSTDYSHHLYIFESTHFDIIAVSARLPLVRQPGTNKGTFVSSILETERNDVIVSYGSGDVESRVLVISNAKFRELFTTHAHGTKKNPV